MLLENHNFDISCTFSSLGVKYPPSNIKMDSEYKRDGRLMDMIDEKWRADQLPKEDIQVMFSSLTLPPSPPHHEQMKLLSYK